MAELVNMKLSKKEADDVLQPLPEDADTERYPWGLRIRLDDTSVSKLKAGYLNAGDEVTIAGKANVVSRSDHEDSGGRSDVSIELQLTDLALDPETEEDDATSRRGEALFPSMRGS